MSAFVIVSQNVLCIFLRSKFLEKEKIAHYRHAFHIRKTSARGAFAWHLRYPKGEIMELHQSAVSKDFHLSYLTCDFM